MKLALVFHGWTGTPDKFRLPLDGQVDEVIYPTLSGHAYPSEDEVEKALHMAKFSSENWIKDEYLQLKKALQREDTEIYIFTHSMSLFLLALAFERLQKEGAELGKIVKVIAYATPYKTKGKFQLMLFLSRFPLLHQLSRLNKGRLQWHEDVTRNKRVNLFFKDGRPGSNKWVAWSNIRDLALIIRRGKRALKKLTVPVVPLQGTNDESVHPSSVKRVCSRVRTKYSPDLLLEGAHHTPDQDEMAEIVRWANM